MAEKKQYDSSVARIAGNIAAGLVLDRRNDSQRHDDIPEQAVYIAKEIIRILEAEDASDTVDDTVNGATTAIGSPVE